jgi:transposase
MHIELVPNRGSTPTPLLRESFRDGGHVRKRTLANLSALSSEQIDSIRAILRGDQLGPVSELFDVLASPHHGHVQAVRTAMERLGFERLLASRPSRERNLVCAMVTARILAPHSKLATTRWWHTTTVAEDLGVTDATADDLYAAMDWLLDHQAHIEKKLAARHLGQGSLVLYDLTSSYFEGTQCPLARFGHNRDGKRGKLQVNYGMLADRRGCPVAVSVFEGNVSDGNTLLEQVEKTRQDFGIEKLVLVGDRGMIGQKRIADLRAVKGLDWITALKNGQISTLMATGHLQLGLFDERNLFELIHPDYPGERLVACRNPALQKLRAHKREALLEATIKDLEKIRSRTTQAKRRLKGRDKIGVAVGRVINKHKMAKHFTLDIKDDGFEFVRRHEEIADEAGLDGIYVIRTSLTATQMSADDSVRSYKALSNVERAFRSLKTVDLNVRPIHHRLADRVRSHIFLCLLAYYVEWHMREAWRPLMFADEDQAAKQTRNPVAPARRSAAAHEKAATKLLGDGSAVHSFKTLLAELATIVRNTCRAPASRGDAKTFKAVTAPSPKQRMALEMIEAIRV